MRHHYHKGTHEGNRRSLGSGFGVTELESRGVERPAYHVMMATRTVLYPSTLIHTHLRKLSQLEWGTFSLVSRPILSNTVAISHLWLLVFKLIKVNEIENSVSQLHSHTSSSR